jgi:hypothetical protein
MITTYQPTQDMLNELAPLVLQFQLGAANIACTKYVAALERFMASGWAGALGTAHELPDSEMPDAYLASRARILDLLENELGRLAIEYRSALTPAQITAAVDAYRIVFEEMNRIGHWSGVPDADSQLPLEHMPALFHAQRTQRIRQFRAR